MPRLCGRRASMRMEMKEGDRGQPRRLFCCVCGDGKDALILGVEGMQSEAQMVSVAIS